MPAPTPVQTLKASLSAQSGILTRQIHRFDNLKGVPQTSTSLGQLESYLKAANVAMDKISDLVCELLVVDPNHADTYNAKVEEDVDRFNKLARDIGAILHAASSTPDPAVAAVPVPQAQPVKVVESLRPDRLSLDFTPTEFRLWVTAFKSFYTASKLDKLQPPEQHAFLYACVDMDLQKRLCPNVGTDTPVFSDDVTITSLVGLLDEAFLHRYPLVQRRLDFFQYPHASGQLASAWLSELRMKGDIADLVDITTDQLLAFRAITGIQNEELQDELWKLKSPTLKDVESEILQYEAKIATKARATAHRITSTPRSSQKSNQKQTGQGNRCDRCGRSSHFKRDCRVPNTVACFKCGKQGHLATVCRGQQVRTLEVENVVEEVSTDVRAVFVRASPHPRNMPTPTIKIQFGCQGKKFGCRIIPDTGATRTIISRDLVDRVGLSPRPALENIFTASGDKMDCSGQLDVVATVGGRSTEINALVTVDMRGQVLMSWQDLRSLAIIPNNFPEPEPMIRKTVAYENMDFNKLFEEYSDVLSDSLGTRCLSGVPMKIYLRDDVDVRPFRVYTTRQIPLHQQSKAEDAIRKALEEGIICREDEPTDWCCRGGFVPKPNGTLRLITDFIPLNKYVKRPIHPFPSALEIVQSVKPDSQFFAVFDCTMGYYQVPLDEASSKLTTFLLPQGRFRYLRAPMGLSASSDEFCRRSDEALEGLEGIDKLVDDVLIQAPTREVLFERIKALFERCRLHGLTLSKRKAQFCLGMSEPPIKFAGYCLSGRGVTPDPDKVSALAAFPSPRNITELRSFLGLANQLGSFVPDLAHCTSRMRSLLRKDVAFVWTPDLEDDFLKTKGMLTSSMVVFPFDPTLPTELITDASRTGLGYALVQRNGSGHVRLIRCGSRSLVPAESRYAIIELETLAAVYGMQKCDFYLRGISSFTLVTDHRPLVGIFNKSLQDIVNPRMQRFREKIALYNFQVYWIAGKENSIADALSRKPLFGTDGADAFTVVVKSEVEDQRLCVLKKSVLQDQDYAEIVTVLLSGKNPNLLPTTHPSRLFSNVWTRLSVEDGLLLLDSCRIIPPAKHHQEILCLLHVSHPGIVKCRKQAQQLYYWPGINNDIKLMVEACSVCQSLQPTQQSEPQIHTVATQAMEDVSVDPFAYAGKHYLMMADRYSSFIWVKQFVSQATKTITDILLSWFVDFGFPRTLRSDGGPQFRSEFGDFCNKYGIKHDVSSPLYPEANGHAESNVKSAKYLLIKCLKAKENFSIGLMELRNTPREDGYSPAQLFFGRRQRSLLPCLSWHLGDVDRHVAHQARLENLARKQSVPEKQSKPLPQLHPGQGVLMQNVKTRRWELKGYIVAITDTGRSYYVRLENGKRLWRNRKYLRPVGDLVDSSAGVAIPDYTRGKQGRLMRKRLPVHYRDARPYIRKEMKLK